MIELFLNEISLDGQFSSIEDFSENGVVELLAVLNDQELLSEETILYKSEVIANAKITPTQTYAEVIYGEESKIYDEIRRYKRQLLRLIDEPFWDRQSKQNEADQYMSLNGKSLNGTSIAEAESRNGILVSFIRSEYSKEIINVKKNSEEVQISNVWHRGQLVEISYHKEFIGFKEYVSLKFAGQKLDFSQSKKVWNNIPKEYEPLIVNGFTTFCNRSWIEIPKDKGLGYKTYNESRKNSRFFTKEEWNKGIKEFRISQKFRCFGYTEGGKFYLLMIDWKHLLGDL